MIGNRGCHGDTGGIFIAPCDINLGYFASPSLLGCAVMLQNVIVSLECYKHKSPREVSDQEVSGGF